MPFTLAAPSHSELVIKKSRFLGCVEPVAGREQAVARVSELRAEHPDARHVCWALMAGGHSAANDDGEPSGTAGAPMLDALVSAGLSDVVAVVTRYFGGVLLGAGGLTRAYRGSVAEAVLQARRVRRGLRRDVVVVCSYEVAGSIDAEARRRGYAVGEAEYSDRVAQHFAVAEREVAALASLAAEASAGTAEVRAGASAYVDL